MVSTMDVVYPGLLMTLLNNDIFCFEQSILGQVSVLLMVLSREWLLLSAVLKHKMLQKPLSTFIGMKVGLVGCGIL